MMCVNLLDKLTSEFSNGISYTNSVGLCLAVFSSSSWIPDVCEADLTKENIARTFALLAKQGLITDKGKPIRKVDDKDISCTDYWLQIIRQSLLSSERLYDPQAISQLLDINA